MPRSKLFSEKVEDQITRLDNLDVGGREQRTLVSISKELTEIMKRLIISEGPDGKGIKRRRVSNIAKEDRIPSNYQIFVTKMSPILKSKYPDFGERSTEMAKLWKARKAAGPIEDIARDIEHVSYVRPFRSHLPYNHNNYDETDETDETDEPNESIKPTKATKATKAKKTKKTTKGGFYENAYDYDFF